VSKGLELKAYSKDARPSEYSVLPYNAVISCIEARPVDFQGYQPVSHLEDIQVVKYDIGDHFRFHFDCFSGMANPRISTIFAYIECDDCVGGVTQFPGLVE
jgi:prolyl 4-hydroxylase